MYSSIQRFLRKEGKDEDSSVTRAFGVDIMRTRGINAIRYGGKTNGIQYRDLFTV